MRILVDLDDTLVDMMTKAIYYYNSLYETKGSFKVTKAGLTSWELKDIERWRNIWKIPGFFADLPFMPGAQDVLARWKEMGHETVIVTAAPTWDSCKDKYQWVHTNLKIPGLIDSMGQLVITRNKHYVKGDVLIDDKIQNLHEHKSESICFAQPWNSNWNGTWTRCHSWSEVDRVINLLEKPAILSYKLLVTNV